MKKYRWIAMILCLLMLFSLAACGSGSKEETESESGSRRRRAAPTETEEPAREDESSDSRPSRTEAPNEESAIPAPAETPQPQPAAEPLPLPSAAPAPEPIPTPTPSPTPQIQTLEIRYKYDDRKRDEIALLVGELVPLYAAILPSDVTGRVEWRLDEAGQDAFRITEDPDNINHVIVECIGELPAGTVVYLSATLYGQEARCRLYTRGSAPAPTPSPTPEIQTLEIRYEYDDRKRDEIALLLGEQVPMYAAILPSDVTGRVEWRLDDAGRDAFVITEDPDNINHVVVECVGELPAGTIVYLYASVYGQEARCRLHTRGSALAPTEDPDSPAARAAALGLPAPPDIDVNSWEFILANEFNPIGEYVPQDLTELEGQTFDGRIIDAMKAMVADTRAQGLSVFLSSGYRSYWDQQYLFNRKREQYPPDGKDSNGRWIVMPPGTSEHQTGLCCDITYTYVNPKDASLADTAMYLYMSRHCQEFGFIVRYPEDKQEITGVMFEPWHFRYVGVEAATYIMENGLCLEEFLSLYRDIGTADDPLPAGTPLGSGSFRSDTGTGLNLICDWSAVSMEGDQAKVTVTVSAESYSLFLSDMSDNVCVTVGGQTGTLSQPSVENDGGYTITPFGTLEFILPLSSGGNDFALSVEWNFRGSYGGVPLDVIECGGTITLTR